MKLKKLACMAHEKKGDIGEEANTRKGFQSALSLQ